MNLRILLLLMSVGAALSVRADYELGPPEQYLASKKLVVVDATVQKVGENGALHLKTHELVVGKKAPPVLKGIALTCEDGTPAAATGMEEGKRYLIVTEGEDLFEATTFWEVLLAGDGDLVCHYKWAEVSKKAAVRMPDAGLHKLREFKKRLQAVAAVARKKAP